MVGLELVYMKNVGEGDTRELRRGKFELDKLTKEKVASVIELGEADFVDVFTSDGEYIGSYTSDGWVYFEV